jgi:hypothetical protein
LRKIRKIIPLITIIVIAIVAVTIFSAGVLQNNSSIKNSQNKDLAAYTGYLSEASSYWYPIRSNDSPSSVSNNVVSFTFADGRTFIANKSLVESNRIVRGAAYTVYYNLTEPTTALDIIKINTYP